MTDDAEFPHTLGEVRKAIERQVAEPVEVVPGAISDVLLVSTLAYKLKRAIRTKYIRYDSTELRRQFCFEEVRLNRKFWPELYRRVLPITARTDGVELDGTGPIVDWVVEMDRFEQAELLPRRPQGLTEPVFARFGQSLASVHSTSDIVAVKHDPVATTWEWMTECVEVVVRKHRDLRAPAAEASSVIELALTRYAPLIRGRAALGWTREIHGDLHPGNLVYRGGAVRAFDCLEYSPTLRQLDVLVDVGAAATGIEDHFGKACGNAFVQCWREVLPSAFDRTILALYRAGRRLVDAKVASILGRSTADIKAHLARGLAELQKATKNDGGMRQRR